MSQESIDSMKAAGFKVFNICVFVPNICEYLEGNLCSVYQNRPRDCRRKNCWDSDYYDELQQIKEGIV